MTNILGDGGVTTIYPVYDDVYSLFDNVSGFFKKINVDDGAIHINQAGHGDNVDDAHLLLQGQLQDHEAFVKIKNAQGTELFRIDNTGKVLAPQDIVAPSLTTVQNVASTNATSVNTLTSNLNTLEQTMISSDLTLYNQIISLQTVINGGTSQAVNDSLVKRDNTAGTMFTKLNTEVIEVDDQVAMYGNANLMWVPQVTVDGVTSNVAGTHVTVGKNLAIGAGAADGLEIFGLPLDANGLATNQVLITANDTAASINLQCNKSNTAPYIRCSNLNDVVQNEISEHGFSQLMLHVNPLFQATPGLVVGGALEGGTLRRYRLHLAVPWSNVADEIPFVLQQNSNTDDEEFRYLTCEAFLDESDVEAGYTDSVVYVDRVMKNVRKNSPSIIRIVLKMELLNGETEIPLGSMIRVTINNQKMLT